MIANPKANIGDETKKCTCTSKCTGFVDNYQVKRRRPINANPQKVLETNS